MLQPIPDQVNLLLALAEASSEEEARRQLAGLLGDLKVLSERSWHDFPVKSVIAALLWDAQLYDNVLPILARQLSAAGPDDLLARLFDAGRRRFYEMATRAMHKKRYDLARRDMGFVVRSFGAAFDVGPERSLLDLMEFAEVARAPVEYPEGLAGRPTIVNLCVWGDRFVDAAERILLPCCLAPGNLPELKAFGTVLFRVHTRAEDVARIRDLPLMREVERHARIDIITIPEHLTAGVHLSGIKAGWNRFLSAVLVYSDLMLARRIGADLILTGADTLLANTYFSAAKRRLLQGYAAVASQALRSVAQNLMPRVETQCRRGAALDIPPDLLYRQSLASLHPFIRQSFMCRTPTRIPMDPVQFYFTTPAGFSLRSFHLSVFAAAPAHLPADHVCDFHTTDTRLLSDLIGGADRTRACYVQEEMPSDIYCVSVDEEGEVAQFADFELSPVGAISSAVKWMNLAQDIDHFAWAIQRRFEFRLPEGTTVDRPDDCRDEQATIGEIVSLISAIRPQLVNELRANWS